MDRIDEQIGRLAHGQADGSEAEGRKAQKRRRYTVGFKRRVVEETLTGVESVSVVARRHDINTNLLFNWRKRYLAGRYDEQAGLSLIPIAVTPTAEVAEAEKARTQIHSGTDRLEMVLSGGHRVVVEGSVSPAVLRTALEVLTA